MDDLQHDQQHLDLAHDRLSELALESESLVDYAPDARVAIKLREQAADRQAAAADPAPLMIGRIIDGHAERLHVGRCLVRNAAGEVLVMSWKAPAARPFYVASRSNPLGLVHRRRYSVQQRRLLSSSDELFNHDACAKLGLLPSPAPVPQQREAEDAEATVGPSDGASLELERLDDLDVVGGEVLLAEMDRGREEQMRDIVATIQADQYDLITRPLAGSLTIQGGPGTGKTAVGLHRASFLLYEDERLQQEGVLVLGPNDAFMDYIAQVLPGLSTTNVVQSTVLGALGWNSSPDEDAAVARLRGDQRMATLLRRAVDHRVGLTSEPLVVKVLGTSVRLEPSQVLPILHQALNAPGSYTERGQRLADSLFDLISDAWYAERTAAGRALEDPRPAIQKSSKVRAALSGMWPRLWADQLLEGLLADLPLLYRLAGDVFQVDELSRLHEPAVALAQRAWLHSEVPLLDELEHLINGTQVQYGHVVVDEAEELTGMEARAVSRRSRRSSFTLLGDLAQASDRAGWLDWDELHAAMGLEGAVVEELSRGFRVPQEILTYANALLPLTGADVPVPVSVRTQADSLTVQSDTSEVPLEELARDAARELTRQGLRTAVVFAELPVGGIPQDVEGHTADSIRGLEFDAVVVVESAAFLAAGAAGARALYVALTRATKRLVVLHQEDLPEVLQPEGYAPIQNAHDQGDAEPQKLTAAVAFALLRAGLEEARRVDA